MRLASRTSRNIARTIVVVALVILVLLALAWRPSLNPIEPPAASGFDPSLIRRGAELAALGDCATCHTAREGSTFAGGRAIPTPFGTIYSTNITPDPTTGIGRWSQAAFARAMREGVDRQGRHRTPVRGQARSNDVPFPLRFRPLLAGWNLLFFREGRYRGDDRRDSVWNRGAYLAEGVAHCGACHTPHNVLGAERVDRHFAGGEGEGWHAHAIDSASQAAVPWDVGAMEFYLRNGWQAAHGVAHGPMAAVTNGMADVPQADVRAVASYVVAGMRSQLRAASAPTTIPTPAGASNSDGSRIYAATCEDCHDLRQPLPFGAIDLSLSTDVIGEDPTDLIHVVLDGLPPSGEARQPIMPGFAKTFSDDQLMALLTYVRQRFARKPLWPGAEAAIRNSSR